MKSSVFRLQANGTTGSVRQWLPDGDVVGVVLVSHGMAEHAGRYEELAEVLTGHGWAVLAGDHRGHGGTADLAGEPYGHFGDRFGWRTVVEDLRALSLHAAALHPDVPLVLLGHSAGSLVARDFAAQWPHALAGLVLSGTPGQRGLIGAAGAQIGKLLVRLRGPGSRAGLLHRLTFGSYNSRFKPARTDHDWLSRDAAAVDAYNADPQCGFVCSNAFYVDLITALARVNTRKLAKGTGKKLPILVQTGSMDPAGGERAARAVKALFRSIGNKNVTLKTYPGARHEVYHETNRAEVFDDLLTWLEALPARKQAG